MKVNSIKKQAAEKFLAGYPDAVIKWQRANNITFPTGLKGVRVGALVSSKGYHPSNYTLLITNGFWTFR